MLSRITEEAKRRRRKNNKDINPIDVCITSGVRTIFLSVFYLYICGVSVCWLRSSVCLGRVDCSIDLVILFQRQAENALEKEICCMCV